MARTTINTENLQWLLKQPIDVKIDMLENHLDICRLLINEILEEEVTSLCGEKNAREKPHDGRYDRWGFNPGYVRLGDHRLSIQVPRVLDRQTNGSKPLESYARLHTIVIDEEYLLRGVLLGLSVRDYADLHSQPGANAMSRSAVDAAFIERSAERLKEFQGRRFDHQEFVALFIDGKQFGGEQIVHALGVRADGCKIPLGFIQATTEHHVPCTALLRDLLARGLSLEAGALCVLDGGPGLRKAVDDVLGSWTLVQRCLWHKRENVLSYLPQESQIRVRQQLQSAWAQTAYQKARTELETIAGELERQNRSAANSLREGLEETLTLHRLGMTEFSRSFATTNCIESLNSYLEKTTRNVKRWMDSTQRFRWVAAGLLEAEQRMRKVDNHPRLHILQRAIQVAKANGDFN
ncbi:MAG: transposase [Blastocatellia bacterium]